MRARAGTAGSFGSRGPVWEASSRVADPITIAGWVAPVHAYRAERVDREARWGGIATLCRTHGCAVV